MRKTYISIVIILILNSCQNKSDKKNNENYFDLKSSLDKEILYINQLNGLINKMVMIDQKVEQKNIAKESCLSDLQSIFEYDLNKPSWKNSFRVNNTANATTYSSIEKSIPVRKMIVEKNAVTNNIEHIRIIYRNENNLFKTHKIIDIQPKKGYQICITQDVRGLDKEVVWVKVSY